MSKLYFASGDVHSFYDEWMIALKTAGFDRNNPDHIVIVCGDLFDRGPDSVACYGFAQQLAKETRLVYVRGNHEDLLLSCVADIKSNKHISGHHVSNGTIQTIADICLLTTHDILYNTYEWSRFTSKMTPFLEFINSNTVDYFELGSTVFVHGWLPTTCDEDRTLVVHENWREGDWREARWDNGLDMWHFNMIPADVSRVVCGHWHCSYGWAYFEGKHQEFPLKFHPDFNESFKPYIKDSLIALDACTAYSARVNVCVFNDSGDLLKSASGSALI